MSEKANLTETSANQNEQPHQPESNGRRGAIFGSLAVLAGTLATKGSDARAASPAIPAANPQTTYVPSPVPSAPGTISPSPIVGSINSFFSTTEFASPVVVMAASIDYIDRAVRYGQMGISNWAYFNERWEEGRKLFDAMRASMATDGYALTQTVLIEGQTFTIPLDYNLPLPTVDQFVQDEVDIFYRTANAHLALAVNRANPADWGKVALSKVLAALGLKDVSTAIFEVLSEAGWLDPRLWGRRELPRTLERLLNWMLRNPAFRRKLAEKIGAAAAARVIGKIAARFIPVLGWALLIGSLLWATYEQWTKPPVLPPPQPPQPPQPPNPNPPLPPGTPSLPPGTPSLPQPGVACKPSWINNMCQNNT